MERPRWLAGQGEKAAELGRIFEEEVEAYFKNQGYSTSRNIRVDCHEIDVLAVKGEVKIACQCKGGKKPVSPDDIRAWCTVCRDIKAMPMVASVSRLTSTAKELAYRYGFKLLSVDDVAEGYALRSLEKLLSRERKRDG